MESAKRTQLRTSTFGLRQRAWWVIRRRISFTIPDLLNTLADGTEHSARGNLAQYVRALNKAGIVKLEDKRDPGKLRRSRGHNRYLLVINSGRKAPVWRVKENSVYDPNTDVEYPLGGTDE